MDENRGTKTVPVSISAVPNCLERRLHLLRRWCSGTSEEFRTKNNCFFVVNLIVSKQLAFLQSKWAFVLVVFPLLSHFDIYVITRISDSTKIRKSCFLQWQTVCLNSCSGRHTIPLLEWQILVSWPTHVFVCARTLFLWLCQNEKLPFFGEILKTVCSQKCLWSSTTIMLTHLTGVLIEHKLVLKRKGVFEYRVHETCLNMNWSESELELFLFSHLTCLDHPWLILWQRGRRTCRTAADIMTSQNLRKMKR